MPTESRKMREETNRGRGQVLGPLRETTISLWFLLGNWVNDEAQTQGLRLCHLLMARTKYLTLTKEERLILAHISVYCPLAPRQDSSQRGLVDGKQRGEGRCLAEG